MGNVARFQQRFLVAQCAHKEQILARALNTQEKKEIVCLITKNWVWWLHVCEREIMDVER
jgi:hypothetical protein